ncbi:MAG: efflux RND transporter permease subunit [Phycisphaerales bacterium]|nr:efflux RND transporter permease subunit [Phycisphaerales bacterium]
MLRFLVEHSLRYRAIVLILAAVAIGYGVVTAKHAKLDVFPDFVQPQAVIQTEAPGLSPQQVEALITRPVESAVSGVLNIESVRSQSIQGLSIITVVFQDNTNVFIARQMLAEQISSVAGDLPQGVGTPKLTPLTSSTMDLLKIGIVSPSKSLMELREFATWTLRPRLQAVSGIADVGIMGGDLRQLQIQVFPDRLVAYDLSLDEIIAAAQRATGARGAGFIETANQRVVIQTEGQSITADELRHIVLRHIDGGVVQLGDVADVVQAAAPKFGDASIQGQPGILVKLLSQYGTNTMEVTEAVEAALAELQPVFDREDITVYPRLHRPATFIETALHHVSVSLYIGAALVTVVLLLFLMNLRTAFISLTAIPLSLLVAIIILERLGVSLNTITLGGLAIAIGEVVDDAIIDVENIFRRLRENEHAGRPRSTLQVVFEASMEVRSAVVYATFVVVLVFVPVLTMTGLQGRMFAPLGIAYIAAILASLVVALTVTPALCCLLLPKSARRSGDSMFLRGIKRAYAAVITRAAHHPRWTIIASVLAFAATLFLASGFGEEFLPEFREGHFVLQVSTVPGTSLPAMMALGNRISHDLLTDVKVDGEPVIATVEFQAGRAELGEDPWGPHRGEIHVELKPDVSGDDQADTQAQIRKLLASYPGITYEVLTFLGDRISETITGEASPVVINIYGDDLDKLDATAERIAARVATVPGATDVKVVSPPGSPHYVVHLRQERLTQFGFAPVDVLASLQTAYQGTTVAQTYDGDRVFDVTVTLPPGLRQDPESIGTLLLRNTEGTFVPLAELADLEAVTGRYMIMHDGARRRQAVTCDAEHRDLASFVEDAKNAVADMSIPSGVYTVFGGEAETQQEARNEILTHSSVAGVGILLLLSIVFRRPRNLLLVLVNLPFAMIGGILAVAITGASLSIGSIVGFVTLFGITMRNSVMMMSHFEHLVLSEGRTWNQDTAVLGATERIVPILMTAAVTGLGLLPIALGAGEVGREIEGPLAIVILGGLITSTMLNLLVLPTLALRYARFDADDRLELPRASTS